jgi:hypothetical protein
MSQYQREKKATPFRLEYTAPQATTIAINRPPSPTPNGAANFPPPAVLGEPLPVLVAEEVGLVVEAVPDASPLAVGSGRRVKFAFVFGFAATSPPKTLAGVIALVMLRAAVLYLVNVALSEFTTPTMPLWQCLYCK